MRSAGLDRDHVFSQLSMVVYESVINALDAKEPADPAHLISALDALPLPSAEQIAEALLVVVHADPGLSADDHVDRTIDVLGSDAGMTILVPLVEGVLDHLIDGPLHWLPDDSTVVFHDTIARRTFTHRFNDAERDLGILTVSVDLAGYGRFDEVHLPDGTAVDQFSVEHGHLAWRGPDGWLEEFQPGDLLVVNAVVRFGRLGTNPSRRRSRSPSSLTSRR